MQGQLRCGTGRLGEKLRAEAVDLIALAPELVVADSTAALTMIRPLARGLPVVFLRVSDPVAAGFVDSLAHPGGNITGFTNFESAMPGKWLELVKDLAPQMRRVLLMYDPETTPHDQFVRSVETAAPALGLLPTAVGVRDASDMIAILKLHDIHYFDNYIIVQQNHRSILYIYRKFKY